MPGPRDDRLARPLSPESFARLTQEIATFLTDHHESIPVYGVIGD